MALGFNPYSGTVTFVPTPAIFEMSKLIAATYSWTVSDGLYTRVETIESYLVSNNGDFIIWQ